MFNYAPDEYAPSLLFANSGKHSAVAVSNTYEILILNGKGETVTKIPQNKKPGHISKKEKDYFLKDIDKIRKQKGWPKSVIHKIMQKIPLEKNFFNRILLSEQHVFIFRIKEDITQEKTADPVDIFSIQGEFLGTAQTPGLPIHISDKRMYFVQNDEDFNLFLVVMEYEVRQ